MKLGNFGAFVAALIAACAGDVKGMEVLEAGGAYTVKVKLRGLCHLC